MRARSVIVVALVALVGCTILTDIPDDVTAGKPTAPVGSRSADASVDARTNALKDGATGGPGPTDAASHPDVGSADTGPKPTDPTVVAVDAVGPSPTGTGGENKTSPIVWSHTTSGTNRALFVTVSIGSQDDTTVNITGVQFEGAALTRVAILHANNKDGGYTTLWALANPQAGIHSVSVAFAGSPDVITAGSISFTGVDQNTPYQNVSTAAGDGTNAKVNVAASVGNMVIGALVAACTVNTSGQTVGWVRNVTCANGGGNGGQSAAPGAASVDLKYSLETDWWGVIGADVKAATQ